MIIMAVSQIAWSLNDKQPLTAGALKCEAELEELIYNNIEIIDKNLLVINRQIQLPSGKILDILCMDPNGDLTIIELKKDMTPRDVVAQTLDYASCVSKFTFTEIAEKFDKKNNMTLAESFKAKFGTELDEDNVNSSLKMVIVAAKMDPSTERIIDYLRNTYQVDINILFFIVYNCGDDRIISRVWHEEPNDEDFIAKSSKISFDSNEYYVSYGIEERTWEDAVKYGFISAGGGLWYTKTLKMLTPGNRVWVNIPSKGYAGVGIVTESVCIAKDAVFNGTPMKELDLKGNYFYSPDDDEAAEYIVKVDWIKTVDENNAVKEPGFFGNQNSVCQPHNSKWEYTLNRLKKIWNITD